MRADPLPGIAVPKSKERAPSTGRRGALSSLRRRVASARRLVGRGATGRGALELRASDNHALTLAGVLALARRLVAVARALALAGIDAVALVGPLRVSGGGQRAGGEY